MSETTFETVRRILVDNLSADEGTVTEATSLSQDLGADSLDAVELIMSLEEEFGVVIEASQAENLKTVGEIVAFVDSLKA